MAVLVLAKVNSIWKPAVGHGGGDVERDFKVFERFDDPRLITAERQGLRSSAAQITRPTTAVVKADLRGPLIEGNASVFIFRVDSCREDLMDVPKWPLRASRHPRPKACSLELPRWTIRLRAEI